MTTIKTTIRNRRINVPAPQGLPDGTEVVVTIGTNLTDDEPVPREEIARVLAAMRQIEPLEIPAETAADVDSWERNLNRHGIDNADKGTDEVFR